MSGLPLPQNYDVSKGVDAGRTDSLITVGFDQQQNSPHIPCFLVRLHYSTLNSSQKFEPIARFDHNEVSSSGHDVYKEGLHIDVSTPSGTEKIHPRHSSLPQNRGAVIRACVEYFRKESQYFIDVYHGDIQPGGPAGWPDGGDSSHRLIYEKPLSEHMHRESEEEAPLSEEELTELLAEATATEADELSRQADTVEIAPPEESEVLSE